MERLLQSAQHGPTPAEPCALEARSTAPARTLDTRARSRDEQQRALAQLRAHAYERSAFYRELHAGRMDAPLAELPVLTKAMLMDSFDLVVTDSALRVRELQRYVDSEDAAPFMGRYWVSSTSGSSGRKTIIPSDREEWATMIASYGRASDWSAGGLRVGQRTRMAIVSSTTRWHQSSRVAMSVKSPFADSHRFDATAPLEDIVHALNELQPEVLIGYASMLRTLALEQLAGRLRIQPRSINASSEVLTQEARQLVQRAFGALPFEVYAATETGGIAAECVHHQGLHLFEDLVIVEPVDDAYRPVEPGQTSSRLLVTVLHSRTLPLIRYELTDRVRLSRRQCPCILPFRLLDAIEGRTDDVLTLPACRGGLASVHPVVFERVLDQLAPLGWQVRGDGQGLEVLVLGGEPPDEASARLRAALDTAGVSSDVVLRFSPVAEIPAGAAGKRPHVMRVGKGVAARANPARR